MKGIKHLVQCHCVLPQYRGRAEPVFHKFPVFSILSDNEDDEDVIAKFSQCNNCGAIHKVIDICKSEIVPGADESSAILTIDDIKSSLPRKVSKIIESHNCSHATWEQIKFIFDNQIWDQTIVISRDTLGDSSQIKVLKISDHDNFKIETHLRQEEVTGEYTI